MKLSDIRKASASAGVAWAGDVINITYNPAAITTAAVLSAQGGVSEMVDFLASVILDWDIIDDASGGTWPVTADNLAALPIPLLSVIVQTIVTDAAPNPTKRAA